MQLKERFATELENREMIRGMEDKLMVDEIEQAHKQREHIDWQHYQKFEKDLRDRRAARLEKGEDLPPGVPEDVQNARDFIQEIREGSMVGYEKALR